jgi:hypothetical protein
MNRKKNLENVAKYLLCTTIIVFLFLECVLNLTPLISRDSLIIKPFSYICNQETRDDFLLRHLLHYDAVKYINANLPMNAKVFTVFLGRRGYYLDREYKNEPSFGMNALNNLVKSSVSNEKFTSSIRSMKVTHILMRTDLLDKFLLDNFSKEDVKRFMNLVKKYLKRVYEHHGYAVWEIQGGNR